MRKGNVIAASRRIFPMAIGRAATGDFLVALSWLPSGRLMACHWRTGGCGAEALGVAVVVVVVGMLLVLGWERVGAGGSGWEGRRLVSQHQSDKRTKEKRSDEREDDSLFLAPFLEALFQGEWPGSSRFVSTTVFLWLFQCQVIGSAADDFDAVQVSVWGGKATRFQRRPIWRRLALLGESSETTRESRAGKLTRGPGSDAICQRPLRPAAPLPTKATGFIRYRRSNPPTPSQFKVSIQSLNSKSQSDHLSTTTNTVRRRRRRGRSRRRRRRRKQRKNLDGMGHYRRTRPSPSVTTTMATTAPPVTLNGHRANKLKSHFHIRPRQ